MEKLDALRAELAASDAPMAEAVCESLREKLAVAEAGAAATIAISTF